ncbi:MAG: hypothetical protein LBR23_03255 [Spirochaetaceae bacterium]|jgi:hypothetical protein|nr:hypothetical protein [Spirochaetaceae bacterium]
MLSGLERELIGAYLADEPVVLFLSPLDEPEQQERLETGRGGAEVSRSGVITIREPPESLLGWIGKPLGAVFYFRKLGLTFTSSVERAGEGAVIKIPQEISRLQERVIPENDVEGVVYYSLSGSEVSIPCESSPAFPLFTAEIPWDREDGDGLDLRLAERAASAYVDSEETSLEPIQGRVLPLLLLFLSDRRIVLGGGAGSFPLKGGRDYGIRLSCALPGARRIIDAALTAGEVISGGNCACICALRALQAEDRRFLYENLYGGIFSGPST